MLTVGNKYLDTVDESCGQNPEASKGNLLLSWRGVSYLIVMYIIYDLFVIKLLRHICLVPAANESCSMRWKYLDISNFTIGSAPHGVVLVRCRGQQRAVTSRHLQPVIWTNYINL